MRKLGWVGRLLLTAGLTGAVLLAPAGPAGAAPVPPPPLAAPAASDDPTPAVPAPSASAVPDPPATTPAPTPTGAAPPTQTVAPTRSPAAAPPPLTPPEPEPATDGILPLPGRGDEYWQAFGAQRDAQQRLTAAKDKLATATTAVQRMVAIGRALSASSQSASGAAATSRLAVDRLAGELYRFGSPVSVVSAMLGAPEDFLSQLDTAHNSELAADLVVAQATDADTAAALARARALSAQQLADQAVTAQRAARAAVLAARHDLVAARSTLAALARFAPQTQVGPDGCPRTDVAGTLRGGAEAIGARRLCRAAVAAAATPQAALALTWAFAHLGAAYACGGAGRMLPGRMDCSSLVSRAYHEGAGLAVAGSGWAPSTRDMVPWDGVPLDPHYAPVPPAALRPGDLVLYDTGGATYRHVVIYLGAVGPAGTRWMLHTNACGDVAKVEPFWGFPTTGSPTFLVARRVLQLPSDPKRLAPVAARQSH